MGITFHGQDADVELDDATLTLVGATAESSASGEKPAAAAGDRVVLLRSDITEVELKAATLLGYGRLTVGSRAGDRYSVPFPRDAQEHFENLEAIIKP